MTDALTAEQFKEALPAGMQKSVNPMLLMRINNLLDSPEEAEMLKENLVSYASVLAHGKFRMDQYINAVRYVSYRIMNQKIGEAYGNTFPEKIRKFNAEGVSSKNIASYSSAYNKSKLVNLIFEQTLTPTHILNAPLYQQALNVQASIMNDPKQSGMVRVIAANNLAVQLKAPEAKKIELDIGISRSTVSEDYEAAMLKMVEKQRELIAAGGDVKMIANAPIVNREVIDV